MRKPLSELAPAWKKPRPRASWRGAVHQLLWRESAAKTGDGSARSGRTNQAGGVYLMEKLMFTRSGDGIGETR
jgi:hypothetical protein